MSWLMFQKDRLSHIIPSFMFQNLALSGKFNELGNGDGSQTCIPPVIHPYKHATPIEQK